MIEESARVLRVEGDIVWIEAIRQSACDSCSAQKGCGHSLLVKAGHQRLEVPVDRNGVDIQPNDHVMIGVPDQAVLKSSLLIYGLPLLLMILLAMLSQSLGANEVTTILVSFGSLIAGFFMVNWKSQRLDIRQWQPKIVRTLSSNQARIPVCEI